MRNSDGKIEQNKRDRRVRTETKRKKKQEERIERNTEWHGGQRRKRHGCWRPRGAARAHVEAGAAPTVSLLLLMILAQVARVGGAFRAGYGKELERRNLGFYLILV